ncbi:hypothetical protein BpHYR1_007316 [Brachionus plicatilis]|uniref:Uncharacterized protein n=1 Tax=Brachionus plicatilis TaxID=10195 RepID=A0A3M7RB47_BRAPC|nr:hypothetical protein BpHYR1_007316 [Brachionus plicatilis]
MDLLNRLDKYPYSDLLHLRIKQFISSRISRKYLTTPTGGPTALTSKNLTLIRDAVRGFCQKLVLNGPGIKYKIVEYDSGFSLSCEPNLKTNLEGF